MSIEIEEAVLKKACMEMIETIFVCLPNAFKGTIYRVGKMPDLIVERITSGFIDDDRERISWGLPAQSGYNPPGRSWNDYRDEPGRPLEAMSWCVEKQKSWTAEDPSNDSRSVRLQIEVGQEDFQHMEPVLVRKSDLSLDMYSSLDYPRNYTEDIIWNDTDYVVVAVIKIHFRPYTITMNSHETRVIKKLSRSLGTELLSYQLRQDSMKAMQDLSRDRLNACNILADSLRNAITKSGLIFSLVKQEIGHLRGQWERILLKDRNEKSLKEEGVKKLNSILTAMNETDEELLETISSAHDKFLELSLPPGQGVRWVKMQIEHKWKTLLDRHNLSEEIRETVWEAIDELKRSFQFGRDPKVIADYDKMPDDVKREWVSLIYGSIEGFNPTVLDKFIEILGNSALNIPSQDRSRKTLIQLKALAETMNQLERNTNFLLHQVLNGNSTKGNDKEILEFVARKQEI
ncbi:hypothetical protein OAC89_02275 [Deltaproteobacteria bacterium]|nr:hypothetical protein [Deltaproteobacteria bacterium]